MAKLRYAKGRIKLKKGEYQRPNGTFEYKWTDRIGTRHSVYAKTLLELRIKEDAILKDILDGIKSFSQNMTINSYYEIWKKVKSGIRDTTLMAYIRPYRLYVESDFGNTKLKDVSYSRLVTFYKGLIENRHLSILSVKQLNSILSMIFDLAVKDGVLRNNPCHGAVKELKRKYADQIKEVKALTVAEQRLLEEYLSRPGPDHRFCPIITVMLYTGMRIGEVCGLRWEDIDFDKGIIHVAHTLTKCYSVSCDQISFMMNPPKTRKSNRFIPMTPRVKDAILLEKAYQAHSGIEYTTDINGFSDFVFLDDKGKVFRNTKLNDVLRRISKKINEEIKNNKSLYGLTSFPHIHAHTLRHTFATRMREAGADIKATADIMGHTEVNLTLNTYTDASQEFKRREISLLDRQVKSRVV